MPALLAVVTPIISLVVGVYCLTSGIATGINEIIFSWILIVVPLVLLLVAAISFIGFICEEE